MWTQVTAPGIWRRRCGYVATLFAYRGPDLLASKREHLFASKAVPGRDLDSTQPIAVVNAKDRYRSAPGG